MTKGNLSWGHLVFEWMRKGHLMGGGSILFFGLDEKRPSVLGAFGSLLDEKSPFVGEDYVFGWMRKGPLFWGHLVLCWMRKGHLY